MALPELIRFYEKLAPENIARFSEFYGENAYFKDPFNEVHGLAAIQRIFTHMYTQVAEPRFTITGQVADANGAVLVWELRYRVRFWGKGEGQIMRGVSHLTFDADGKVTYHRDYWDTAEELYMKLPVIGLLMRALKRMLAA